MFWYDAGFHIFAVLSGVSNVGYRICNDTYKPT